MYDNLITHIVKLFGLPYYCNNMDTKEYYGFTDTIKPCLQGGVIPNHDSNPYKDTYEDVADNDRLIYGLTFNPIPNKRIALLIPGQRSVCKMYSKYTYQQQYEILNKILLPFEPYRIEELFPELTDSGNLHYHTTLRISNDSYPIIRNLVDELNNKYSNAKQTYVACDLKLLLFAEDRGKWYNYIRKELKDKCQ